MKKITSILAILIICITVTNAQFKSKDIVGYNGYCKEYTPSILYNVQKYDYQRMQDNIDDIIEENRRTGDVIMTVGVGLVGIGAVLLVTSNYDNNLHQREIGYVYISVGSFTTMMGLIFRNRKKPLSNLIQ